MKIKTVTIDVRLSENTKRAIRWVLLPVAVMAGSIAVARAYSTAWIATGQPISASNLKGNLDEIQNRLVALEAGAVKLTAWADEVVTLKDSSGNTLATSTYQTTTAKSRRVGDSLEVMVQTKIGTSGPPATTGYWVWTLPNYTLDTTKYPMGSNYPVFGTAEFVVGSIYVCHATRGGGGVALDCQGAGASLTPTLPATLVNGTVITMRFTVPISGWTATTP